MPGENLTGQFISSTFQRLLQVYDDHVRDGTGSLVDLIPVTSSHALTASYIQGVSATTPGGGLWSLQFNSASTFQGSNNLLFNNLTSTLQLTGSLNVSGSITVNNGITGSLFGTSSYATYAASANLATSATQASTVRVDPQDTTTNAFKPFLLPRELSTSPISYYSRLDETPLKLNPAKNTIRFTPNDTGQGAALEIGDPDIPNSGQLVVHGPFWAESLNTLPGTITFVDTINTASFNKLTDLSFVNNALVLTTGSYSGSFIGNLTGTSSWANNYSETDPVFTAKSASLATTGSNQFKGNQGITGSLDVSGSFGLYSYGSIEPSTTPSRQGLFYFTNTDLYISLD